MNFICKVVVELDANAVVLEFPWDGPTEAEDIHTVGTWHGVVIASRHKAPKRLDGGADPEVTRIAVGRS